MANEDRFFIDDAGQIFFRGAGNQFVPVDQEDIPTLTEHPVETLARAAGEGAAGLPLGLGELIGAEGAAEQRQIFEKRAELRELSAPGAARAGGALGYAPDVAAGLLTGGTSTLGRVAAGVAVEGALGALRNPEDPLSGAIIQGALGGAGSGLAPAAGATFRAGQSGVNRLRGTARLDRMAEHVDSTTPQPGGISGIGPDQITGSPGSITGVAAEDLGRAGQSGFTARLLGLGDNAPAPETLSEAQRLGFRLTPADRLGGAPAKNLESMIQRNPIGQSAFNKAILRPNQEVLNNLYRRSIGLEDGTSVTAADMGAATNAVHNGFRDVAKQIKPFNPQGSIPTNVMDNLRLPAARADVAGVLKQIPDKEINGDELFELVNGIREDAATKFRAGETSAATALEEIADSIETEAIASAPNTVAAVLKDLRARWRNIRLGERGSTLTEEGDIGLMPMRQSMRASRFVNNKYRRGGKFEDAASNDLFSGVRTMSQFRERMGNSGTPTGSMNILSKEFWLGGAVAEAYLRGFSKP